MHTHDFLLGLLTMSKFISVDTSRLIQKSARKHFQNKPRSNAECFFKSSVYFHKQLVNEFNRIRPFQKLKSTQLIKSFLPRPACLFKTFFKDVLVSQSPTLSRDDNARLKNLKTTKTNNPLLGELRRF